MSLRYGETGKRISITTSYDMVNSDLLQIKAVPPSGKANTKTWTAQLGQALANVTLEDGTVIAAVPVNQSVYYDTQDGDLDEVGTWTLVAVYGNSNSAPDDLFKSNPVQMLVETDNYSV